MTEKWYPVINFDGARKYEWAGKKRSGFPWEAPISVSSHIGEPIDFSLLYE